MMKPIPGYEGLYSITEDGRIWSYYRNKWKKPQLDKDGYLTISLYKNRKRKGYLFHRLVAQTYIPNPENKPEVNHKNGIKDDNRVEDLEWVTRKENSIHAYETGLTPVPYVGVGEEHWNSKLTWKQVREIRKNHKNRKRGEKTWEKYNISQKYYYYILSGKGWKED